MLRLRAPKQLLQPRGIFETLFERFRALAGIDKMRIAFEPRALLLGIEELAEAFGAVSIGRAGLPQTSISSSDRAEARLWMNWKRCSGFLPISRSTRSRTGWRS